jgi:hypothetical protein
MTAIVRVTQHGADLKGLRMSVLHTTRDCERLKNTWAGKYGKDEDRKKAKTAVIELDDEKLPPEMTAMLGWCKICLES